MKKKMTILLALVLSMVFALAACGNSDNKADKSSKADKKYDLVNPGEFTFAASGEFKPFSYPDPDDPTKMTGFDIAVGKAIAKELGLKPHPVKYKFGSIIAGIESGRFDAAVASHTVTDDRKKHANFSTPYYYSGPQIYTRPDSGIKSAEDLKGKEVAVSKGSTYASMVKKYTNNIKTYDSDVTALEALSKGKHDAVVTDFVTGQLAIKEGFKIKAQDRLGSSKQAVAVSKKKEKLLKDINKALKSLRESGKLSELSKKFIGSDITKEQKVDK
ncbi:amino acid ABC transporter substrate-binding protein (PAAT family) [Scopulibacillus darangshiensis]|uniref:Amino acid ABC transporter substrate-binding protein (PAAT family) n=1 Tax=Scopulibacillus darangshiensis TaxID=442528 RepID=A0A4V2SNR3_9BACL|nr:transporter substrate-binding domain-containing protein [Scopulibacillus darangshiensis]TCP32216.1 amino acid ABC transporter substrate-binding protein (PAAT family) [Scopulibacillus darangshiensis]